MPSVIIDDILPRTQLIAAAGQTVFNTTWTANAATDIVVYARADDEEPNDLAQEIPQYQYNVDFIGQERIVRITFLAGRELDDVITITRNTPASRLNLYSNTNFVPSMLNNDFGIMTFVDQQNELYDTQIALRYNVSATLENYIDNIIPVLDSLMSWRMNEDRTAIETFRSVTLEELENNGSGLPTGPSGASLIGLNPTGNVQDLANALHVLRQPSPTMPNAFALSTLPTGIMRNVTSSGFIQISSQLTNLDSLTIDANKYPLGLGLGTYQMGDITDLSIQLLTLGTQQDWRNLLGVGPSGEFLRVSANLSDVADLPTARNNLGLGTMALEDAADYLLLAGGTMTGPLYLASMPVLGSEAATKAYVDAVTQNNEPACNLATTVNLTAWTYDNGASGIGATLTAPSTGQLVFDLVNAEVGMRILVKNQVNPVQNGIYTVTNDGTTGNGLLTRATNYDQPTEIQGGDITPVVQGVSLQATQWMMTTAGTIVVGTSPINWTQITGQGALLRANNLADLQSVSQALQNLTLGIPTGAGNVVRQTSPNLITPALGTPSNGNLVNCTGYPVANVSGLGSGVAAFLANPTSANLATAVTNETGSGSLVFGTNPAINSPFINTGLYDVNQNMMIQFEPVVAAANFLVAFNTLSGNSPGLRVQGSDPNIALALRGFGNRGVDVQGVSTNVNAPAGYVREYISVNVPEASAVSLTSNIPANIASMNLTAGDWNVWGVVNFNPPTVVTNMIAWSGTTSATAPDRSLVSSNNSALTTGTRYGCTTPFLRVSVATTTTVYLQCLAGFASGTGVAYGTIYARRV